ncbi:protein of unknown function [Bradyrhizobium vignae]|uniref:Uncharacterized protein n=1 Tax=Bradyrhizobium vignae TaxID=1549949 RepID=A0A2U3Q0M2_9BRAD|nr:protein of unknown function [Bradyrhizobium vignae]
MHRNSKVVFCNFLDMKFCPLQRVSTAPDLTGAGSPPMFGSKRPTRVLSFSAPDFPVRHWN